MRVQGFNRYSYCLNNPLLYIDEDGEMPLLLAGTLLGGCVNLVYKACSGQIHSAGDAFAAFGIGAVAGLAGTVTGGWAAGLAGGGFLQGLPPEESARRRICICKASETMPISESQ